MIICIVCLIKKMSWSPIKDPFSPTNSIFCTKYEFLPFINYGKNSSMPVYLHTRNCVHPPLTIIRVLRQYMQINKFKAMYVWYNVCMYGTMYVWYNVWLIYFFNLFISNQNYLLRQLQRQWKINQACSANI